MSARTAHGRPRNRALLALAAYLGLALAFTCPLATRLARAIPGDGFDGWQNVWNLWWIRTALLEQHAHPWFTDLLFHPTGVGLLFHTLNPFNGLAFLPVQLAWGLLPAYNVAVLFSFAVGGLGAGLLARRVLGPGAGRLAPFAAGVVFAFSPYHFAHLLGHMQLISLQWIPFFVLYLLRAIEGRGRRTHDIRMAALFLVLVTLCDWYYLLYCLLFAALVALWTAGVAWRGRRSTPARGPLGRLLIALAAIGLLWMIVLSPLLVPMVRETAASDFMAPDPEQSRDLSADLVAFVLPQEFHPIWGAWAQARAQAFTSSRAERQVFAGYTVLALALLALLPRRILRSGGAGAASDPRRSPSPDAAGRGATASPAFWALAAVAFAVLALGPVLHVAGRTDLLPGGRELALPYAWLVRLVPFMDITRSVSRLDVLVMLALAVLAACGLARLPGRRAGLAAAGAIALILFEFLPVPYPISPPDTPDWFASLAADPRPGAVLNLPANWDRPAYLLHQTVHGRPLATAYISRDDPRTLADRAPVLQHFRNLGPDIIAFDLAGQGRQVLADLGVRWVVLDRHQMPGSRERVYTEATARAIFAGQAPVYEDERLTVYEVDRAGEDRPYLILGVGWERYDDWLGSRAFTASAPVIVQSPAAGEAMIRIDLARGSAALDAPGAAGAHALRVSLQAGANVVTLHSRDAGARVVVERLALEP